MTSRKMVLQVLLCLTVIVGLISPALASGANPATGGVTDDTVRGLTTQASASVAWDCPVGDAALIAPNPGTGRPLLDGPAACAGITASAGAELWGIYYLVETGPEAGTWLYYVPGFVTSTLTQLEPDKFYWVVVSDPCTLTIPQEPTPADGIIIESLLVTADHCYLNTYTRGYEVGKLQEYHIECIVSGTGNELFYQWSCTHGWLSGQGSLVTWIAPDTSTQVTITATVSDSAGNTVSETILLDVVPCLCAFGC